MRRGPSPYRPGAVHGSSPRRYPSAARRSQAPRLNREFGGGRKIAMQMGAWFNDIGRGNGLSNSARLLPHQPSRYYNKSRYDRKGHSRGRRRLMVRNGAQKYAAVSQCRTCPSAASDWTDPTFVIPRCQLRIGDAPLGADPKSIFLVVDMDSGLAQERAQRCSIAHRGMTVSLLVSESARTESASVLECGDVWCGRK